MSQKQRQSAVTVYSHPTGVQERLGRALSEYLQEHAHKPILLLVSGGSSLEVLAHIDPAVLGTNLTASMMDDRFSTNEAASNFLQLMRTEFYNNAVASGATVISTAPRSNESLSDMAKRWASDLSAWKKRNESGMIVALLGLGEDGHTAGIFPFPEDLSRFAALFEKEGNYTIGYDVGERSQYSLRVTATAWFLRTVVDCAFVYVSGENKRKALANALKQGAAAECPARVLQTMKEVHLYTDIDQYGNE